MELRRLFKYRDVWLGAAMLWVVLFHSGFWRSSELFLEFKAFGYGGVDICLFASGIGCYYSLEKDPDILRFLKRRVKRLAPTYLCFMTLWLLWAKEYLKLPITAVVGNILGIQTLASWDYQFNWYISALVVFYICLPYLKRITDSCRSFWQDLAVCLLLLAVSIPFWNATENLLIIVSRLPVLYAGVVFAKMAEHGYILKKRDYLLLGIAVVSGAILLHIFYNFFPDIMDSYGLHWYPFLLITPGLCLFLSLWAEWAEKNRILQIINRFLGTVGAYSFEVYLVHVFLYESLILEIFSYFNVTANNLLWLLTLPVIACGAILLNIAGGWVGRCLTKLQIRKKHDRNEATPKS